MTSTIWALADLHLAFGVPSKDMGAFGPAWAGYAQKIEKNWKSCIAPHDLVLIPGDISWAMSQEEAIIDLQWIDALPGHKIILRGNHDYWWPSNSKLQKILPPSIRFIHNNAITWGEVTIGGTRLWDTPEYRFGSFVTLQDNPLAKQKLPEDLEQTRLQEEKIFHRELERLRLSLRQLDPKAKTRIALIHYPPISAHLNPSRTSQILEEFHIDYCLFGHLHNVQKGALPFGQARGVRYLLTSCDYLNFAPLRIC